MALAQSQARPQQTYMAQQGMSRGGPSGLAEVLDVLLDKGLVIDVFVRVSLVGIELLTIDARVVIASVDTYLRFAEAVNRLDLQQANNSQNLGDLVGGGSGSKALSSRGSRNQPAEPDEAAKKPDKREQEPDDEAEDQPDDQAADQPDDETEDQPQGEASGDGDGEGDEEEQDDKGILTRIKERGQVF